MEPAPLTCQVNISDGAQKAHIVVIVVSAKTRVRDDLQRSVPPPQRAICDADCVHHHQPVSHLKHVAPAQNNPRWWRSKVRCDWSSSPGWRWMYQRITWSCQCYIIWNLCVLLNKAVGSSNDPARGDDGTSTNVSPSPVQTDLPTPFVFVGQSSSNNASVCSKQNWAIWKKGNTWGLIKKRWKNCNSHLWCIISLPDVAFTVWFAGFLGKKGRCVGTVQFPFPPQRGAASLWSEGNARNLTDLERKLNWWFKVKHCTAWFIIICCNKCEKYCYTLGVYIYHGVTSYSVLLKKKMHAPIVAPLKREINI